MVSFILIMMPIIDQNLSGLLILWRKGLVAWFFEHAHKKGTGLSSKWARQMP
jgi:hypothetical protein